MLALAVFTLIWTSTISGAREIKVEDDISGGDIVLKASYNAYLIDLKKGDGIKVSVRTMSPVDIYFMNSGHYNNYKNNNPSFSYERDYSQENTNSIDFEFEAENENIYALVIDNRNLSVSGSMSTDEVPYEITINIMRAPGPDYISMGGIIVIIIISFAALGWAFYYEGVRAEKIKKEENAKKARLLSERPILLPPPPGQEHLVAKPPSSECKTCPYTYDANSPTCIYCEFR